MSIIVTWKHFLRFRGSLLESTKSYLFKKGISYYREEFWLHRVIFSSLEEFSVAHTAYKKNNKCLWSSERNGENMKQKR